MADFEYKILTSSLPSEVDFTNASRNADSYVWDFGDNTSSRVANPKHSFAKAGLYSVKLTANGLGGAANVEKQILIGPTKMTITSLSIDSAVEVANPMYFFASVTSEQNSIILGDYYLPPSATKYYPKAAWSYKQTIALHSDMTIKLFYKLPGDSKSYPAGANGTNTFTFKPVELTEKNTNYPARASLINGSGATQNKISMWLTWE
ncbi:hypothetical protein GCM10028827_27100 [Mucilaginibacter myungsuensis]